MADTKISQLPEATSINQTDILPVVINPDTAPENRKIKVENLLVKATGSEVNAGTDDSKIVTPKAIADSNLVITDKSQTLTNKTLVSPVIDTGISGTAIATGTEVNTGTDDTKIITPYGLKQSQALIPRARIKRTNPQSISPITFTIVTFETEDFDIGNMFDTTISNNRLIVPSGQGGLYLVGGSVRFRDNTSGGRIFGLKQNGAFLTAIMVRHDDVGRWQNSVSTITNANPGDYFQLEVYHENSTNLDVIWAIMFAVKLI